MLFVRDFAIMNFSSISQNEHYFLLCFFLSFFGTHSNSNNTKWKSCAFRGQPLLLRLCQGRYWPLQMASQWNDRAITGLSHSINTTFLEEMNNTKSHLCRTRTNKTDNVNKSMSQNVVTKKNYKHFFFDSKKSLYRRMRNKNSIEKWLL